MYSTPGVTFRLRTGQIAMGSRSLHSVRLFVTTEGLKSLRTPTTSRCDGDFCDFALHQHAVDSCQHYRSGFELDPCCVAYRLATPLGLELLQSPCHKTHGRLERRTATRCAPSIEHVKEEGSHRPWIAERCYEQRAAREPPRYWMLVDSADRCSLYARSPGAILRN